MAIPRFARAFIKGVTSEGYRGIMAKAQEEADALKTEQEQEFELLKIKDRAHLDKLTRLEILQKQNDNLITREAEKEKKLINDTRTTLSGMGWEDNTLDYLASIKALNGLPTFNVWASQHEKYYNSKGENPDWHLKQIKLKDGTSISWQEQLLNQVNASKNTINSSDVASILENENGLSSNVAKSQVDITGATTTNVASTDTSTVTASADTSTADTSVDSQENISTDVESTDFTPTVDSATSGSGTVTSDWRAAFKTQSPVLAEQLLLTIDDMSNEKALALVPTFDPQIIIDSKGTKGLKLTLQSNNQYRWNIVDIRKDIMTTLAESDRRDKNLTAALVSQPGLFVTKTPIYMDNGELNPNFFQNLDETNALKYTTMKGTMINLNNYAVANDINLSAGVIARKAVAMYKSFDMLKTGENFNKLQVTGLEGNELNYEIVKQTGLIIRDDITELFKAIDLPIATTAQEQEHRNIVINGALSNYRSQLLNEVTKNMDSNTDVGKRQIQETKQRYGIIFDNMMRERAQGNPDMNYWDNIPEGRTVEGTLEKDLLPSESAGGTTFTENVIEGVSSIEPTVMAGSEPSTQTELDSMDKLLSTQTTNTDKEAWLKSNTVKTSEEMGGISKWRKEYGVKGDNLLSLVKYDHDAKTGLKKFVDASLPANHVQPRPKAGSIPQGEWDRIWSKTHNLDGTPK